MAHGDVKHDYHLVNPSPWPFIASVGALIAATTPRRPVALPPSPVVHVAAAPPCPACPPCAACPACPAPTPPERRHR